MAISDRSDASWRGTFHNPTLNRIDPETSIALRAPPGRGPGRRPGTTRAHNQLLAGLATFLAPYRGGG